MSTRTLLTTVITTLVALVASVVGAADYKGPIKLLPTKDGATLYSLNMDSKDVSVINVAEAKIERTIALPGTPNDMCFSPDEKTLYVGYGDYQGKIPTKDDFDEIVDNVRSIYGDAVILGTEKGITLGTNKGAVSLENRPCSKICGY